MENSKIIDIHCHIIPQVDDGSDSIETSIKLADMLYEDGIRTIVTTPHYGVINPSYDPERVTEQFELLSSELAKKHPDMKLYRGNEIFIAPGYSDGLDEGRSCTLAGSQYVLVEFEYDVDYDTLNTELRKLLIRGYFPILAHAERYIHAYKNVRGLKALVDQGVMIQVNGSSICTLAEPVKRRLFGGNSESKVLREMLTEGLIHFIASDCHDMPGRQSCMISAANVMKEIIGEERTREILVENPKMLWR